MDDREAVRQKLVLTTIELIEQRGLSQVTVRAVAQAAGVNVAAISYYFGSKKNLIRATLDHTLNHMMEDVAVIGDRFADNPIEALTELLGYLLEGSLRYPNITRSHMHKMFTGSGELDVFPGSLAPVVRALADSLERQVPLPAELAKLRAVQAFSAALFPALFGGFFEPAGALTSATERTRYIEAVVVSAFTRAD